MIPYLQDSAASGHHWLTDAQLVARALATVIDYGELPSMIRRRRNRRVADAYDALVATARRVVGGEAHDAWNEEPVATDSAMNMGQLFEQLSEFRRQLDTFEDVLARTTLPRRRRVRRR